jgi:tRNA U34 5-methylaminomethyl-2-thiouridine-forming methyltransferase MnmC
MAKKQLESHELEVLMTEDQSKTLLHKELGAHYRSVHGANIESNHVFIQGTRVLEQKEWTVLELGFGLGTNFRNLLKQRSVGKNLHYLSLDHQLVPPEVIDGDDLGAKMTREALALARKTGGKVIVEREFVILELLPEDHFQAELPLNWANACFHDPFAPKVNPESWTVECFAQIFGSMTQDGILSTYGAAGRTKRAMVAAGFWIASGAGYGRKREITFASKNPDRLSHGVLNRKYRPDKNKS